MRSPRPVRWTWLLLPTAALAQPPLAPEDLALSPSGRHLFVTNYGGDTITQIDTATNRKVRDIQVGAAPLSIVFIEQQ